MLKLENSIRGLSFSRVAFDLTIQDNKKNAQRSRYSIDKLNTGALYAFFLFLFTIANP